MSVVLTKGNSKVKTLKELVVLIERAKQAGQKVVLCHGVFDLLHPGHIVHFQQARKYGEMVVVTLTPDRFVNKGPGRPVFNEKLRLHTLSALEDVDYVAINEWPTATETLQLLKPDVYVKGSDYADASKDLSGRITDEEDAVRSIGGRIEFTEGVTFSSSHLINRFFSVFPEKSQEILRMFRSRYSADQVIGYLQSFADLKVLVIGETILDQYCYCNPVGKSPKEAIVATQFVSEEIFAGGAVATANHLAGFCREVTFVTALGPDKQEETFLLKKLRSNIRMIHVCTDDRPTIRKRRYLEPQFMKKMFEVQHMNDTPIHSDIEDELENVLDAQESQHDLIVVNDFGHGLLTRRLRNRLSSSKKFVALNTQSNSANLGFNPVTNYARADYVSIDAAELHLASQNKYGKQQELAQTLRMRLKARRFLVSLGAGGSILLSDQGWHKMPALATRVVDRIGAGDALFAITAPCAFKNVPSEAHCFIGNCVGALAVEIVCNRRPIEPVSLYKFISSLLK